MNIMYVLDTPLAWQSGIWFHRNQMPSNALMKRGHGIKQVAMGRGLSGDEVSKEYLEWPDTVIFGRTYNQNLKPVKTMRAFKKAGKRVLYDMDDDFWQVSKHNPSALVSNAYKDQYEGMIKEADALITPSKILAKKFKKLVKGKPIFLCPNGVDENIYRERSHNHDTLMIGYMGAASHWKDLSLIVNVVDKLSEKHDFYFVLYGLSGEPLEAAMYFYERMLHNNFQPEKNEYFKAALEFYHNLKNLKMLHIPFHPPELHPGILSRADLDIGLAPLEDTPFNKGKSCVKFYEYAAVGTVTLASDVEPYKSEVNYRAKNTFKDWYNKLEKLIVDEKFRKKILSQQTDWVKHNRTTDQIGLPWELACQRPGGLKVAMQETNQEEK